MTARDAPPRRVLVVEPQRLVREAMMSAIAATPGLEPIDGDATGPQGPAALDSDAAVLAARSLGHGWTTLVDAAGQGGGPCPVVLIADHGPDQPSVGRRCIVVASRQTSLGAVTGCLQAGVEGLADLPVWQENRPAAEWLLTARERQVLALLASGISPAQIARALGITTYTVRDHIKSIRSKLDRPTTMSAVLEAIRLGLLQDDDG